MTGEQKMVNTRILDKIELNRFYRFYLEAFEKTTDAPMEFIFTTLLASLGAALANSVWMTWGNRKIYPNVWIMLVGSSTLVRKSTSLNTGLHFNLLFDAENPDRHFRLPDDGSLAAFLEVLANEKKGVLRHSEVATLLNIMSKGYNVSMKALFTDFFDVPGTYKIHLKGEKNMYVDQPIFSMATATTPVWLKKNLTMEDWTSGFGARFLYCYKDRKDISIPIPRPPDAKKIAELKEVFAVMYELRPREITFDESFERVYTEFYNEIETLYKTPLVDDATKSLIGRLQTDYFLKLTMFECVLGGKSVATEPEARRVIDLIWFFIAQAHTITGVVLKPERTRQEEKVLEYLRINDHATKTDLYNLFSRNIQSSALNAILKTLMETMLVSKKGSGRSERYELIVDDTNS